MNKIYSLLLICLFSSGIVNAQAPSKFSYQAVVRDGSGTLISNEPVGIQITISESSATGTSVYVERHTINSNENGLVSLEIGSGTLQSGNFGTIDWGSNNYFLKSEIDPNGGTSYTLELSNQLLSVPYALYANTSGAQTENDPVYNASPAASITATDITSWNTDLVDDADNDATNEIQDLSFVGNILTITNNTSATSIDLSSSVVNTDTSALTEAEVDAYVSNNGFLTTEIDGSITNEIQDLSLVGNILTITNNGSATSIDLSGYLDNTDTSVLTESEVDAYVANNGFLTTEVDGSITNEIQTLTQVGDSLFLSNSGGAVSIADLDTSLWESHPSGTIYSLNQLTLGTDIESFTDVLVYLEDTLDNSKPNGSFAVFYSGNSTTTSTLAGHVARIYAESAGVKRALSGEAYGVSPNNQGVFGLASDATDENIGVIGIGLSGTINKGVEGNAIGTGNGNFGSNAGILGFASGHPDANISIYGGNPGLGGAGTNNYSGMFDGNVIITGDLNVVGNIAKGGGTFKIDHPLDPENKYLVHSFIESPKMLNIYNGKVTTDANGFAVVKMAEYVEAANKDFLYQLTVMGTFAQAIVKEEIENNQFLIQTNEPNVAVCWEVTGVRADNYANANRVIPELEKEKKGTYLHPELYDESEEKSEYFENIQSPTPVNNDKTKYSSGVGF
tara:strand:- start:299 stop:2329 length:2031 start_codon:yes stop_codon:yes gene_type:complete